MSPRKASIADRVGEGYFQSTETATESPISPDLDVERTKRTWYISNNALISLAELQSRKYRETGKKPELSSLVEEALELLFAKYAD